MTTKVVEDPWPAPTPVGETPLSSTVVVPGSKSLTNRYLVLAALADGLGIIRGGLRSRDTDLMALALSQLGVEVSLAQDLWQITPQQLPLHGPAQINCGLAGTVMRFLPAVAALASGEISFDGDPEARVRPMGPILTGLQDLGVQVSDPNGGYLPFKINGTGQVTGGEIEVDASGSSQFVSGLLLAAARFDNPTVLKHIGQTLPSVPHIDMTVATMREAGIEVDDSVPGVWRVTPGPIAARDVYVEPDLSNASPFLAAALVLGGTVRVPGWPAQTTQPGGLVPEIFTTLGASAQIVDGVMHITGTGEIKGHDLDLHDAGELTPTICALLALADGPSRISGIAHLRGHETDRLAALATEINKLGGDCQETADGLMINPRPLHGAIVNTYHDHRMATFAAILGLRVPGIGIENIATTSKTLPDFPNMWLQMLRGD